MMGFYFFRTKRRPFKKINTELYGRLLHRGICKEYMIVNREFFRETGIQAREIMINYNLDDRTEPLVSKRIESRLKTTKRTLSLTLSSD